MSTNSAIVSVYDSPRQFEPLLPQKHLQDLALSSRAVIEASMKLQGAIHPSTRMQVRELVRSMNSYYSNLIEGQSTHPRNIDRALHQDFSKAPDVALRQRVALAHIRAEQELETLAPTEAEALASRVLREAHRQLYERLSVADRTLQNGQVVQPGELREQDVQVGRHQPPAWQSLPSFLARADEVYAHARGLDASLYSIAAAHQRMTWVHPFLDGNGRACRLQTHCALLPFSGGLWSVNRGLARQRPRYYELLSNADMPRQGDLDGRGNLSEKMLREWCSFFIELCRDQVSFMTQMLDLDPLKERITGLVLVRSASTAYSGYRSEAVLPLHHVLAAGPVSRGDFIRMTGLGERTGRKLMSRLLQDGLLVSDNHKAPVGIGFPLDALNLLFPNLYPEAATTPTEY